MPKGSRKARTADLACVVPHRARQPPTEHRRSSNYVTIAAAGRLAIPPSRILLSAAGRQRDSVPTVKPIGRLPSKDGAPMPADAQLQGGGIWIRAVQRSFLPPSAKLACLNLSTYMQTEGEDAAVTLWQLKLDTGLPLKALANALRLANEKGFLIYDRQPLSRTPRASIRYVAAFPGSLPIRAFENNPPPAGIDAAGAAIFHPQLARPSAARGLYS